jgi:hypothetical protein
MELVMRRHIPIVLLGLVIASPAAALDMPARKAGLWEIKMSFEGRNMPAQTSQHCVDAATDKQMNSFSGGMSKDACSKQDIQTSGGKTTVDSVCKFGATTTTSHAEITGSFDSAYTVKVAMKSDGAPPAMQQANPGGVTNMTIEAKWAGACKADQKPGDIMMANGMKMNIRDLQNPGGAPKR